MIKINLLNENKKKKGANGLPHLPIVVILLSFVVIAAIIGIVVKITGSRPEEPQVASVEKKETMALLADTQFKRDTSAVSTPAVKQKAAEPVEEAVKSPPPEKNTKPSKEPVKPAVEMKPAVGIPPDTSKSKFAPSTHASADVVEDVVRDKARKSGSELMALSYKEMSRGEKINYEIAFTKKIFELITHAVPEGIEFSSLGIDSFTVIKATGIGPSRELVASLFRSLRDEKNLHLRERPASSIRPLGRKGYRFDFSCDATFGVDTSTYIATSDLKPHESFSDMLKVFSKLVSSDGISLQGGLDRIANEEAAGCRRYTYHMSGSSAYRDFVKLVLDLQKKRLPCSFNRIHLRARNDTKITIDADVVFTLLD
jgi:hypothetical protein